MAHTSRLFFEATAWSTMAKTLETWCSNRAPKQTSRRSSVQQKSSDVGPSGDGGGRTGVGGGSFTPAARSLGFVAMFSSEVRPLDLLFDYRG